jgi:hypothetical protein
MVVEIETFFPKLRMAVTRARCARYTMGVEYRHYLISRPNSFRPNGRQLAALVESLAKDNWIAAPGSDALREMALLDGVAQEEADDGWARLWKRPDFESVPRSLTPKWFEGQTSIDLRLGFPVNHGDRIGLCYPLVNDAGPPEDPYYEIELRSSRDYVHHVSEEIEPALTICVCGEPLEYYPDYDVFYASRIKIQCPRCSAPFDPSSINVVVRDGWTGDKSLVKGGAIYRFAIVVDCGKCIPERRRVPIKANPRFVDLCQRVMGCAFYEIGDIY